MSDKNENPEAEKPEFEKAEARPKMTEETRKGIELLMEEMIEGGFWGYKGKTDPVERELAFQSEAMAEKLFAHLYADDPKRAKLKWQEFSGKPADKGLISRAESIILEQPPEKALENLSVEQKKLLGTIKQFLGEKDSRQRERDISQLRGALGDSKRAQKDYRRKAIDQVIGFKDQEPDGFTIVKAFVSGATRAGDDFASSWRERDKAKEMTAVMKEIREGMKAGDKSQLFQALRGAHKNNMAGMAGVNVAAGFGMAAATMMKDIIVKMTGMGRKQAMDTAPQQTKMLLLTHDKTMPNNNFGFPGNDQGQGLGMA